MLGRLVWRLLRRRGWPGERGAGGGDYGMFLHDG